jgi:hypothetical protein
MTARAHPRHRSEPKENVVAEAGPNREPDEAASAQEPAAERRALTVDNLLERSRHSAVKEGLGSELSASEALLRSALALREMQAQAAQRTREAHGQAQVRLRAARSVAEAAGIGLQLAQTDAQAALRYWGETSEILLRGALDGWADSLGALARAQALASESWRHWLNVAAQPAAATGDATESTVQPQPAAHAQPPLSWPTQDAVREAMTLGARSWNEWLSAMPSTNLFGGAASSSHH